MRSRAIGEEEGKQARALLSQIRVIDTKRLVPKVGYLDQKVFVVIPNTLFTVSKTMAILAIKVIGVKPVKIMGTDPPFDPTGSSTFTFRYYDPRSHKMLVITEKQDFKLSTKIPMA